MHLVPAIAELILYADIENHFLLKTSRVLYVIYIKLKANMIIRSNFYYNTYTSSGCYKFSV